jgi:simple sugar transport system ATP-binding protein
MKILYGMLRPDAGTISIDGREVTFKSPHDAIGAGVGMVHQHFMLADNLTVLENVILGNEPSRFGWIDADAAKKRIAELGAAYGLPVEPDRRVEELGVGARQRVEILKVLFRGARILILDEPTTVLVPHEVSELFANLEELKREGITTIFISHKLNEVLTVADRITVIRAGSTVTTVEPAETTARELGQLMVGSELPTPETRESTVTDRVVLAAEHLSVLAADGRVVLDDCSFDVHAGEIVGVAGVEGNGQTELIEALMGLAAQIKGTVRLGDDDITYWDTRRRREHGLGYVPEDRQRDGLLLAAPCWENDVLGHQTEPTFSRGPWIDRLRARRHAREVVSDFDVRTPSIDVTAQALSGGNQQKLIMGRELTAEPRVLIAAHPTRGVDVGAQAAIWDHLREARRNGLAVLLISADLEELIGLSDALLVLFRGSIVAHVDPATVTPESLGSYMTGTTPDAA